jgi:UDP-glucose 4-epimerase
MRLLVTGGAGYIGSVVSHVLLARGHEVTVLDDLSTGHADAVPDGAQFVHDSIVSAGSILGADHYDGVVHFAAKSLVGESMTDPSEYWHGNVMASLALIDAVRDHQVPRMVFSSTAATYGAPTIVPITEDSHTRPTNPYGATKLAIDMMLASYSQAYGLGAVSLRYFNVAGAVGRFGERHTIETHLIPLALHVCAGMRDSLSVYGTDYDTPDGTCIRDYIHVVDLADAHVRALEYAQPGRHEIFNLGVGQGFSVREVIDTVRRVTGHELPIQDLARRPGDPAILIASSDKAKQVLGWRPGFDLTDMVRDAWDFITR